MGGRGFILSTTIVNYCILLGSKLDGKSPDRSPLKKTSART